MYLRLHFEARLKRCGVFSLCISDKCLRFESHTHLSKIMEYKFRQALNMYLVLRERFEEL